MKLFISFLPLLFSIRIRGNAFYFIIYVDCGAPPTVADATFVHTGTTYRETATYTCDTGYTMAGTATITCQASSAWEITPACIINGQFIVYENG